MSWSKSIVNLCIIIGMSWIPSNAGSDIPMNAVIAGHDIDGAPIYVGRSYHDGDLIPAKVIPSKQIAYIAYNGQEIAKYDYHVSK